jgi:hypothetical protein
VSREHKKEEGGFRHSLFFLGLNVNKSFVAMGKSIKTTTTEGKEKRKIILFYFSCDHANK